LTTYRLIGIFKTNWWVSSMSQPSQHESKRRILNAAPRFVRDKGRVAPRISGICQAAALTTGRLARHFKCEEAPAAAEHLATPAEGLLASAPRHKAGDPVDRLLGYVDFRTETVVASPPEFAGLPGMMVQETYATHPAFREAHDTGMVLHIAERFNNVETAGKLYAPSTPNARRHAAGAGYFMRSVRRGAFIIAKATRPLGHARRRPETLFDHRLRNKTHRRARHDPINRRR
jgi:TetR/AcrR family transcriptional repressor of nem operon